jgi:uncharacterized phage protein gp47/JayE
MAAAFENKTIAEIRDLLVNSFQEKFNIAFRLLPKSFIRVIATIFAGVYITLYKQIGWLFLQLYPDTAYWGEVNILGRRIRPLVKWGILIGVGEPRIGSQWQGSITVRVLYQGSSLIAGTQLKSEITGKLYITEEGAALESNAATVAVICAENGTAGNLEAGDSLSFVSPLGTVERMAAVAETTVYAMEDESEAEYRARVVNRFRNPPLGGALADYRRWAGDVPGVLNTYPYKDTQSPSGVLLYVSGAPSLFPDRIPSADLLKQVGKACVYDPQTGKATRKPITAVIDPSGNGSYQNVRSVTVTKFDVYITGIAGIPLDDFADAARPVVENYFFGREPYIRGLSDDNNITSLVSRNSISSAIDQTAVPLKAEFSGVTLQKKGGTSINSYTLGVGELSSLDKLYLNGALYE